MIIQAISYGEPPSQEFAFTYSGDFTDNRDENGIGTVTLNTSGTLTVTGSPVTVSATIVGGGGGGALSRNSRDMCASGGGGGIQTVEITLKAGTYEIVIGTGGAASNNTSGNATGGNGGDTIAFEKTSTGGTGGKGGSLNYNAAGVGGTPNGGNGAIGLESGGTPNGGAVTTSGAQPGGDGYVELMFS